MTFLKNCPDFWGPWNHASLTSIAKKNAEIKIGIRKGISIKGLFSIRKYYSLDFCKQRGKYRDPGTVGVLIGNLIGWTWLKSKILPKHLKFLHPYLISHPRAFGHSFSNFLWEELVKLGLWTLRQGDVTVRYKKTIMKLKWKVLDNHVYGIAKKIKGTGKLQLESLGVSCKIYPDPVQITRKNFYKIQVFENKFHFTTDLQATKEKIKEIVNKIESIPSSLGDYKEAVEALITIIGINSLKTPDRGWLTSLMRRASVLFKGWNIYLWDNSFIGMMSTIYYPQLAIGNIKAICAEITHQGFLPNQAHPLGRSESITQLPVTSYCALKIQKILQRPINKIIRALESNNNWWLYNRDPNRYHLLSYGSELKKKCTAALKQMAQYESGMDNHPMFDKAPVDYKSGCIALYPVGLNSIYALDCQSLSLIAKSNGNAKLAEKLTIRYENMKKVINKHLWDGKTYRNLYWNGEFQDDLFPNYLFPLIAGIPSYEQAKSTVKTVLKKCLTPFGIAPSTINHSSFKDQITWRGRLLPPIQFLVSESLRRYEFDLEASDLAQRCYRCFYQEWHGESHFHESYNGYTGDGDDVSITGEPNHPWAGLFPYLSIQDLIDYEIWNGIRLGRLKPINAAINDIPIQGNKYSVNISEREFLIKINGKNIIKADYPLILRKFEYQNGFIFFKSKSLKPVELELYLLPGNYQINVAEESFKEQIDKKSSLNISLKQLQTNVQIKKL
ncbi:MAG: MGH1-like glycoside hydrolase domain-containing protein [Promethearchaeota archaeon]